MNGNFVALSKLLYSFNITSGFATLVDLGTGRTTIGKEWILITIVTIIAMYFFYGFVKRLITFVSTIFVGFVIWITLLPHAQTLTREIGSYIYNNNTMT